MRAGRATPPLIAIALGLLIITLVFGLPTENHFFLALNNFAHAPVFAVLAIVIYLILSRQLQSSIRLRFGLAFVIALAIGSGIELIQPVIGRDGQFRDVITDGLGAVAGLALVAFIQSDSRRTAAVVLVLAGTLATWPVIETTLDYVARSRQAPALLEMSSRHDWAFIWTRGFQATLAELPAAWRQPNDPTSLLLQVEGDTWRVLSLTEPLPDWREFNRLMLDLTNPDDESIALTLRIHDRTHNNAVRDRFNGRIDVPAAKRVLVEIPLALVAAAPSNRRMDMSEIAGVMIFATGESELVGRHVYVTRVWLESNSRCEQINPVVTVLTVPTGGTTGPAPAPDESCDSRSPSELDADATSRGSDRRRGRI